MWKSILAISIGAALGATADRAGTVRAEVTLG